MGVAPAAALEAGAAHPASRSRATDLLELTKPRITFLVLVTAAVGFALGLRGAFDAFSFLCMLAGTGLLSGGAAALNQYLERESDGRMDRTRHRPLPSGRVAPSEALRFGLAISTTGLALLAASGGSPRPWAS